MTTKEIVSQIKSILKLNSQLDELDVDISTTIERSDAVIDLKLGIEGKTKHVRIQVKDMGFIDDRCPRLVHWP